MPRSKFSALEKMALITEFEALELSNTVFLGKRIVAQWIDRYQCDDLAGLNEAPKNHHYSSAFKL